ncbi:hypothetical protein RYX36_036023 [Vicia faba]
MRLMVASAAWKCGSVCICKPVRDGVIYPNQKTSGKEVNESNAMVDSQFMSIEIKASSPSFCEELPQDVVSLW